ncbi:MAG: HNH endonuclease [Candidatus Eisenbacteria bacterium]|uniref:HNH endonuclease n=1 Tax=Eiseniibacteriota bacterium TaxID=2212470 RepID=A0A933SCQ2_UNCEI|nr:HNH endonuclease [Candidatus Eisenbacteria bacterium]
MSQRFDLSPLSHQELDRGFAHRVEQDRAITAELIAYLGEVGARGRHLTFGYSSLFDYCTKRFGMSEDVAKKRIRIARLARRHPALLERLADGRIGLTALLMMSTALFAAKTDEANVMLDDAAHKTNDEVAMLLVARSPKPDTPTAVEALADESKTKTPAAPAAPEPTLFSEGIGAARPLVPSGSREAEGSMGPESASVSAPTATPNTASAPPTSPAPPVPRTQLTPLAPTRFDFRTTLDEQTLAELREAAELLSHVIPNGDLGLVLARLVREGLQQVRKQRRAEAHKPRAARVEHDAQASAHIPEHIVRAVYARDKGCCTFRADDGHVCGSRWRVEIDHVTPRSRGGRSTLDNLRLLCRAHNQHEAERVLGAGFMRGKRAWARMRKRGRTACERPEP